MPIGSASAHVNRSAASDTTTVIHRRSPSTSATGRCHSMDSPKSPVSDATDPFHVLNVVGPVEAIELAHPLRLLHGRRAAAGREARNVGVDEVARRQLNDE